MGYKEFKIGNMTPKVSSVKSVMDTLKSWEQKFHEMPELVVIDWSKIGELAAEGKAALKIDFKAEICRIMAAVDEYADRYNQWISVVVTGNITDKDAINGLLELGVDGVQLA